MSEKDTGGPAFPTPWAGGSQTEGGMTLRDWFAGPAMAGLLAGAYRDTTTYNLKELPEEAYKIADAMLEARK